MSRARTLAILISSLPFLMGGQAWGQAEAGGQWAEPGPTGWDLHGQAPGVGRVQAPPTATASGWAAAGSEFRIAALSPVSIPHPARASLCPQPVLPTLPGLPMGQGFISGLASHMVYSLLPYRSLTCTHFIEEETETWGGEASEQVSIRTRSLGQAPQSPPHALTQHTRTHTLVISGPHRAVCYVPCRAWQVVST